MRVLTTKFGTYKLGKYEKATGKSVMDLLDIGNLEINKIAEIIKLGNTFPKGCDEDEEAYKKLDDYLGMSDEHSLISAFFDLIDDLDKDLKIMKSCGLNVSDIKENFKAEIEKRVESTGLNDVVELADKVENTSITE
jgi:hypothetical protein